MKNNHLDGSARPSLFTADPAGGRAAQDPARSRARSCPARGRGCCGGVAAAPLLAQSRLCVPGGERRRGHGGFSRDNGKTNPRALPKLEIHVFKYHIAQQECSRRAGSTVGLIPKHHVPVPACKTPACKTPACKPGAETQPHTSITCPCAGAGAMHGDGASRGHPGGTGGYPERCKLLG